MKTFRIFVVLAAILTVAAGCQKESKNDPENEKNRYDITVQKTELFSVDVPDSAFEGDEVTLSVTLSENTDIKIVSVKYNGETCEFISEEGLTSIYRFTMPAENVEIAVSTAATAFSISWEDSDHYQVSGLNPKAKPGDIIEFKVSVTDLVYKVTQVTYGEGLTCAMKGDPEMEGNDPAKGPLNYLFSFTMPENDVTIDVSLDENLFRIYRTSPENATISMLNLIKTDSNGKPLEDNGIQNQNDRIICEGKFGDKAFFTVEPDSDQWSVEEISVTGKSSGNAYSVSQSDSPVYGLSYSFTMPAEEVSITATMKEEESDIYEGKDFVGNYSGFMVKSGFSNRNLICSISDPTLAYTLSANASYTVTESEDNSYNGTGKYIFDEESGSFSYNTEVMSNGEIGLSGTYKDGIFLVTLKKIGESISYNRSYIAAMDANGYATISDFVSASDDMGYNVLIGFKLNNEQKYYLYEQLNGQTYTPVTVNFTSGASLDENGARADIIKEGSLIYKYSLENNTPVFKSKGIEAGTYDGSAGTLVLDGFGNGTLAGIPGTYTSENNVVTFVDSGQNSTTVVLNYDAKTYSMYDTWDGPMYYSVTTDKADDGNGNAISATLILNLENADWNGNPYFRIEMNWPFESSVSYTYDSSAGTLTILFIDGYTKQPKPLQQGSHPGLDSIVFKVSENKQTLEILDLDILYNYFEGHVVVDGLVLTAGEH